MMFKANEIPAFTEGRERNVFLFLVLLFLYHTVIRLHNRITKFSEFDVYLVFKCFLLILITLINSILMVCTVHQLIVQT